MIKGAYYTVTIKIPDKLLMNFDDDTDWSDPKRVIKDWLLYYGGLSEVTTGLILEDDVTIDLVFKE